MDMSVRAKLRREARKEDGAAAVEFALIVGLLAILVFGLLEYGLAFWQVQNLRAATREGARVAAVGGDQTEIRAAMVSSAAGSLTGGEAITVTPLLCNATTRGQQMTVRITGNLSGAVMEAFKVSIPFLPPFTLTPDLSGSFRCEG
jgi:Flp pilus assembly protein TadG